MTWGKYIVFLSRGNRKYNKIVMTLVLTLIFLASLLVIVTLVSENVEASYGLQITVRSPQDKDMDASSNPQSINFTIDVENVGTEMENITITVTFDDPGKPTAGWTVNPNNFTINNVGAGINETREIIVTAPVDEPFPSFGQLTVTGYVQEEPTSTSQTNFIARVSQILDVIVTPSGPSSKAADPGESIPFMFNVKNNGTSSDNYNLIIDNVTTSTSGDTGLWFPEISFTPTSITNLARGGIVSVTMDMDVPYPADLYLIPPGLYNITVEVSSTTDSNVKGTLVFTVDVKRIYWADVQDSVTTETVDVGASVQYQITIKNKGNDNDLFSVEIHGDPAITGSQNWGKLSHFGSGQMSQQALWDIDLNAGSSTAIILEITIPDRTDPGYPPFDPDIVTLTIIVKPSDEMGIEDEVNVTADINPIYEFAFNFLAKKLDVDLGNTAVFTIKIENKGTTSETFTYDIMEWEMDWSAYGYSFTPSSITIPAASIGDVTFSVNTPPAPEDALSQDYKITIRVHSLTGDTDLFKNCTVHIEPFYNLDLTISDSTNKSVNVGDSVTYQFTIRNIGNVFETFSFNVEDLDITSEGGGDQSPWASICLESAPGAPLTSVDLNSGETKFMILKISVPNQGSPNFAELSAPLDIMVEAASMSEPNVIDSFTTSTTVNPIYSFELSTTAPANTRSGIPGDTVLFTLQVRNIGTIMDSYNFYITSFDESIFSIPDPTDILDLGVDNYGTSIVRVNITTDCEKATVGSYQIRIHCHSFNDPSVFKFIYIYVDIESKAEIELDPTTQTNTGDPGAFIDYIIQIENMGNDQDTFDLTLEGTYKDWGEVIDSLENPISQVTLSAQGQPMYFRSITVRVTIPGSGEASAGQSYPLTLKVTSTNDDSIFMTAQMSTTINDFVDLVLEYSGSGNASKDYDPNKKSPKFSFRVTNNGNQDENSIEIRVDNIDDDWDYNPTVLADSLEPGGASTFSMEFTIPSDESIGEYQLDVFVVSSVDPSLQTNPITITVNITKPDLSVSSSDVLGLDDIDKLKEKVGNAVTISANIQNIGDTEAKNVQVKLYEDSTLRGTKSISSIAAGGLKKVDFRWTVVSEEVEIRIEITPQEEIDEGNNEISPILLDLRPDLSFSGNKMTFSNENPYLDQTITINTFIANSGGKADNVIVNFYEGVTLIGKEIIDIDFEETKSASISWKVPNRPGEQILINAEIDHPGSIGDGDATSKSIIIKEITKESEEPDLELVGNLIATEGESFTYKVNIVNYDPQVNYTFSDDSDLFDIDPITGDITFKPGKKDAGTHMVTITVSDDSGNTDSSIATFRILEAEEDESGMFNLSWIILIVLTAVILFIAGYFMGGKNKEEPQINEEPQDLEEPEPKIPPPPPEDNIENKSMENSEDIEQP